MSDATPTLEEARDAVRRGAWYGDAYEGLAEADRPALAEWFVREPGVPSAEAVRQRRRVLAAAPTPTGEACPKCGGLLVRTGTCMTCQSCAESTGGCG